jgi:arginyl-tRNA synthetase
LKYADLSQNRTSDYEFSYDKMLSLDGNTATYMQYAYARTQSIFARGEVDPVSLRDRDIAVSIEHPSERALAMALLRFDDALASTTVEYRPNLLTSYLYDLARTFSDFFRDCPVLKADTDALRQSRLLLCDLTGRTIKLGLSLLGIGVADKM